MGFFGVTRGPGATIVAACLLACAPSKRATQTPEAPPIAEATTGVSDAQRELEAAFQIVRTNSLWRDTVTWSKVEPEVRARAAGAKSFAEAYPAIRLLVSRLGDRHSSVTDPAGARAFRTGGAQNPRAVVRIERDSIGYVALVGYAGNDSAAARDYAKSMQDSLGSAFARGARCRWIVDLRGNTGGNMWPMLGGLRPLLGEGEIGAFVPLKGAGWPWRARDWVNVTPPASLAVLESAWVAVLTGPRTVSSGEAVTISFRGRPRTRSFGLPTAGKATGNNTFPLPDGGMIVLTTQLEADRTGRRYVDAIGPDEVVHGDSSGGDAALARALDWLRSKKDCR